MAKLILLVGLASLITMTPGYGQQPTEKSRIDTPGKRAHHALVYDEAAQRVVMTAGSTPLDSGSSFLFYNDLWTYDGTRWRELGSAGNKRSGIRLVFDSKRKTILSFGGYTGESLGDLRELIGTEWKQLSDERHMKTAEGGLVYDSGRDRLIAVGGSARMGHVDSTTWEWDGNSWKEVEAPGPEGRHSFAIVYDSKRRKTVLFGGRGTQTMYGDTWEFDGARWTRVAVTGPSPRMAPGFAYDSKRGLFIIFGGAAPKFTGDTWAWDGATWTKLAENGPAPRVMGYMAYDKARDVVVLFGGRLGWPNDENDTWEWDGNAWRKTF